MTQHDTFYDVPKRFRKKLIEEALTKAYEVLVDEKPSSSWSRRSSNVSVKDAVKMLDDNETSHLVFIHRRRHIPIQPEHIETGFSTMRKEPDIFLFIYIDIKELDYFVQKYKMKPL